MLILGCKQSPETCENSFLIHEPLFSSPPIFQPVFHNRLVPSNGFYGDFKFPTLNPNSCYENSSLFRDNLEISSRGEENSENNVENKTSSDKEKSCRNDVKKAQNNAVSLGHYYGSNNLIPWAYSPFFVPVISYFVSRTPGQCLGRSPSNVRLITEKDTRDKVNKNPDVLSSCPDKNQTKSNGKEKEKDEILLSEESAKGDWLERNNNNNNIKDSCDNTSFPSDNEINNYIFYSYSKLKSNNILSS